VELNNCTSHKANGTFGNYYLIFNQPIAIGSVFFSMGMVYLFLQTFCFIKLLSVIINFLWLFAFAKIYINVNCARLRFLSIEFN
jgi:hypothetical protein